MFVLGGGAFACVALGYLGLHYMGGESISEEEEETIKTEVNKEIKNLYNEVDTVEKEEQTVVDETLQKEEQKITGWGQFWKGAYEEDTSKVNDVAASDFN